MNRAPAKHLRAIPLALAVLVGACGGDGDPAAPESSVDPAAPRYDERGPFAVDTVMLAPLAGQEDAGPVTVWFPVIETVPADVSVVDLVVFGHGQMLPPDQYSRLFEHAAGWGVVIAAPENTRDTDLADFAVAVREAAQQVGPPLADVIEPDGDVVAAGHSAGTAAASEAAAGDGSEAVVGSVLMAGGGTAGRDSPAPTLFLAGGRDGATSTWVRPNFEERGGPVQLVEIVEAGHLTFSDLCFEGDAPGLRPEDCAAAAAEEEAAAVVARHAFVAFLRWRLGADDSPLALSSAVIEDVGDTPLITDGGF